MIPVVNALNTISSLSKYYADKAGSAEVGYVHRIRAGAVALCFVLSLVLIFSFCVTQSYLPALNIIDRPKFVYIAIVCGGSLLLSAIIAWLVGKIRNICIVVCSAVVIAVVFVLYLCFVSR